CAIGSVLASWRPIVIQSMAIGSISGPISRRCWRRLPVPTSSSPPNTNFPICSAQSRSASSTYVDEAGSVLMSIAALPEQGQLVEVRQRRYVVTDIRQSTLPPDPLKLYDPTPQHRVTLASVEDDALGEELQVIWEIE